mmetsp:Transcript_17385/g.40440  ORF Transcript_17385/g.40440 Transcript_17385/m.40440 type:complete len:260 (-) Transcript_17385:646-1425(-)
MALTFQSGWRRTGPDCAPRFVLHTYAMAWSAWIVTRSPQSRLRASDDASPTISGRRSSARPSGPALPNRLADLSRPLPWLYSLSRLDLAALNRRRDRSPAPPQLRIWHELASVPSAAPARTPPPASPGWRYLTSRGGATCPRLCLRTRPDPSGASKTWRTTALDVRPDEMRSGSPGRYEAPETPPWCAPSMRVMSVRRTVPVASSSTGVRSHTEMDPSSHPTARGATPWRDALPSVRNDSDVTALPPPFDRDFIPFDGP